MFFKAFRKPVTAGFSGRIPSRVPSIALAACAVVFSAAALNAQAPASVKPSIFENVSLDQRLNSSVPLDLHFRDENGKTVRLGDYFGSKPIVLTLVYYQCPMLCTQILNGVARGLHNVPMEISKDFDIVTVSINPRETQQDAAEKKHLYASIYADPHAPDGWHFLTGDQTDIKALADAVGFHYAYDQESGEYAHPSGIMILTPEGRVSRYFYGVQYPSRDLRLALIEASNSKIGSPVAELLLYCYHYDPQTGKYGLVISNVLRIAGVFTMLGVGGMVLLLNRSNHKKRKPHVV